MTVNAEVGIGMTIERLNDGFRDFVLVFVADCCETEPRTVEFSERGLGCTEFVDADDGIRM
jgi:hypothetical protein